MIRLQRVSRVAKLFAACLVFILAPSAFASSNGIVISQIYGGGGNSGSTYRNDFIEVFNAGNAAVSLNGWSVQYASAAGTSWQVTALGNVLLQPGQYLLVQESAGAGGTTSLTPDVTGNIAISATAGKVALLNTTTALTVGSPTSASVIDFVGFGSTASFAEGSPTAAPGNTTGVLRANFGCTDTDNNAADFTVVAPNPRNTASPFHPCNGTFDAPIVATCPATQVIVGSGGTGTATATDPDSVVNGVTLGNASAGITLGTLTPAAAAGGTASVPIVVSASLPAGSYPYTLTFTNNASQSATCSSTVNVGSLTPIYSIQGSGSSSPLANQTVITQGVVTRVVSNGFYMQDPTGDGDPTTSDGIFVFTSFYTVRVNDLVRVGATVVEFNVGQATNTDTASHTITELSSVSSVNVVGSGSITPTVIGFPFTSRDQMEQYEHMLVTINGPLTVAQNYYLGQYGQLTVAALGAVETPTNRYRPGASAQALYADNKRRSLIVEDGVATQYPNPVPFIASDNTVRQGDTLTSITGVIDYGLATDSASDPGSWRIIPTVTPQFTRANARTTTPDDVGGTIRVASANVENFFTTFTNGQTASGQTGQGCTVGSSTSASNCRGADSLTEFMRQRAKIVEELVGLNADVIGIMELQNNGPVAIGNLVDAINARIGSTVYAAIPDPAQGTGTDAIKVGMIYKPAKLTRSGASVSDPNPIHNRAPLAQAFVVPGGQTFTLVVNHLKSKGCSGATGLDTDQGDLQSCFNNTRRQQAAATRTFVTSLFPSGATPNALLVGDFNAYAMEDPIADMTANGYTDELGRFNAFGYSYQFDGSSGRIDQALTTPALSSKVKRALEWHVNADEPAILDYNLENKQPACAACAPDYYTATPYRASDHDPLVVGISFGTAAPTKPTK